MNKRGMTLPTYSQDYGIMVEPHPEEYPLAYKLIEWVQKREAARVHGKSGDPNIDNWRYCNVRRQDDKVTRFITDWLAPYHDHPMLIPNVVLCRLFNQPETIRNIGWMSEWDPDQIQYGIEDNLGTIFNAAYIVSTNGRKMDKVDYLCEYVLPDLFINALGLSSPELDQMWQNLTRRNGIGSFMAAQVIADLKDTTKWRDAPDYWTFVAPGPGSMRGMNRLRGKAADYQKYNQKAFSMFIQPVRGIIKAGAGIELCAHNVQNCLCEFDKYMRLINGEGRPKQTYGRKK